ncbi:unnamed protein product [Adineta steineri]|nr:unnamed protein product [Adineta steineri]
MCDTSGIVDCNSLVRTTATIEDEDIDKEQNKCESKSIYRLRGLCPLTFNGAFGLTAANHSMHFCLNKKTDLIGLYDHFLSKHQLQSICIRRLLRAISNNEDPKTTKLFNENEDVINHLYKMPCPFSKKMTHLIRCPKKNIKRVPCTYILSRNTSLNWHLQYYHGASSSLARELVVQSKKIQMKNINSSHD